MKRCRRLGLDVTKHCNLRCNFCFYRWSDDFNIDHDMPLSELKEKVIAGKKRGCQHLTMTGWGEPGLYKHLIPAIEFCNNNSVSTSIVTNGTLPLRRYMEIWDAGIDHFHVSIHGLGPTLNKITNSKNASKYQEDFKRWLLNCDIPWRANLTLIRENINQAELIALDCIRHGVRHFVILCFLPLYEWKEKVKEIAAHPAELRYHIESVIQICARAKKYFTLRYFPFCHLKPDYWKYVVNGRYVLYDPWEWEYGHGLEGDEDYWKSACHIGNITAIEGEPCDGCAVHLHCGGWNRYYAAAFEGAGLKAISKESVPAGAVTPGFYHIQNPANNLKGWIGGPDE